MGKKRSIALAFIICLCFPILVTAEVIVLKSGKTVEGKIIEKTDKYIKIDFEGIPLTYFLEDIESIDGVKLSSSSLKVEATEKPQFRGPDWDDYFIHSSRVFKIVPPKGFNQVMPFKDGVQFNEPASKSFLSISFSDVAKEYTDNQLILQFNNEAFRKDFIKGLEKSSNSYKTEVINYRQRYVNGIPAWEFLTEGIAKDGSLKVAVIVLYKNNKEFYIIFSSGTDLFDSRSKIIEESLATFEIL